MRAHALFGRKCYFFELLQSWYHERSLNVKMLSIFEHFVFKILKLTEVKCKKRPKNDPKTMLK